ncbi:helix-turn-helix domain-containing protein [Gracilibacillus sp. HCP3S3_G5_1]|uniref:helix-turn-helix domain-containing protein n=1 Tax=unclassified Gracilibacillus TaxID=2625209 RepID=UPI003F8C8E34
MRKEEKVNGVVPFLQPHFNYDTKNYRECLKFYHQIPLLFYQFMMEQGGSDRLPAIPDGCLDIIICLSPSKPTIHVYGSLLLSKLVPFKAGIEYFGVRLPPGCMINSKKVKMKEFVENVIDLSLIMEVEEQVIERMLEDAMFEHRVIYFEKIIRKLLSEQHPASSLTDYIMNAIIISNGGKSIQQLATETNYSDRYIRQQLTERLGIPPKNFSRIVRFQHALKMLQQGCELEDIIYENNYYDQAHLIHEFENFAYITPTDYQDYVAIKRKTMG